MKNELEKKYTSLEPEELLRIVNSPSQYTAEAIDVASSELRRRNLSLQNLLSSSKLLNVDLIRMALKTNKEDDIIYIVAELKKRDVWTNVSNALQTELRYSTNKILAEVLPEGMQFNEKFEALLSLNQSNINGDEKINIIMLLFQHIAQNIVDGKDEKEIFSRLHDIGVDSNILLRLLEPFFHRVKSSLSSQKPTAKSYAYALFAGLISIIICGAAYGYFMINTNSKLNYILIFVGVFSGLAIHVLTGGKKGVGITIIGIFSTLLAILLGNVIFAVNRNVALPLSGFDFLWGIVGIAFVVGLSRMIKSKHNDS